MRRYWVAQFLPSHLLGFQTKWYRIQIASKAIGVVPLDWSTRDGLVARLHSCPSLLQVVLGLRATSSPDLRESYNSIFFLCVRVRAWVHKDMLESFISALDHPFKLNWKTYLSSSISHPPSYMASFISIHPVIWQYVPSRFPHVSFLLPVKPLLFYFYFLRNRELHVNRPIFLLTPKRLYSFPPLQRTRTHTHRYTQQKLADLSVCYILLHQVPFIFLPSSFVWNL